MTMTPLRALIVDDEPLAAERLAILCGRNPALDLIGTAADGERALALVATLAPDLLLLDISMPGLDGMAVAAALGEQADPPSIVFCTAFDRYAVAAFDVAAVDYLLKPVAEDRLALAIERVVAARAGRGQQAEGFAQEFWVPHRAEMIRVPAADIDRVEAERDYMRLHVGERSYLVHQTITELERRLDPRRFIRLHRSAIVRRDRIAKLRHDGVGVWQAELVDGAILRVGRTHLPAVRAMMGRA